MQLGAYDCPPLTFRGHRLSQPEPLHDFLLAHARGVKPRERRFFQPPAKIAEYAVHDLAAATLLNSAPEKELHLLSTKGVMGDQLENSAVDPPLTVVQAHVAKQPLQEEFVTAENLLAAFACVWIICGLFKAMVIFEAEVVQGVPQLNRLTLVYACNASLVCVAFAETKSNAQGSVESENHEISAWNICFEGLADNDAAPISLD